MRFLSLVFALIAAPFSATAQPVANTAPLPRDVAPAIVLLLPAANTPFVRAAEAVRQGFFAAHAAAGAPMAIQVVETEETPIQVIRAIDAAQRRGARLVVGPLTRDAVDALVQGAGAALPVLALNVPSTTAPLPPSMLAFGLPVEDEARSVVRALLLEDVFAMAPADPRPFAVIVGGSGLEQRAGAAFLAALHENNLRAQVINFSLNSGALAEVAQRLAERPWRALLLALSASEAAALQPWWPAATRVIGTSRLHLIDPSAVSFVNDLEGVYFVDMPWLIEPDHPAVMAYPRSRTPYTAELERLYALGIDAYRVASEWIKGSSRFEVDGVTGWLRIDPVHGGRVERLPSMAVFVKGRAERKDVMR